MVGLPYKNSKSGTAPKGTFEDGQAGNPVAPTIYYSSEFHFSSQILASGRNPKKTRNMGHSTRDREALG